MPWATCLARGTVAAMYESNEPIGFHEIVYYMKYTTFWGVGSKLVTVYYAEN